MVSEPRYIKPLNAFINPHKDAIFVVIDKVSKTVACTSLDYATAENDEVMATLVLKEIKDLTAHDESVWWLDEDEANFVFEALTENTIGHHDFEIISGWELINNYFETINYFNNKTK